jgi:hypothetical protein
MSRYLRYLRILWAVFGGLACVLLITFWIRSYWRADFCEGSIRSHWLKVESFGGQFVIKHYFFEAFGLSFSSYPIEEIVSKEFMTVRGLPKFELGPSLLLLPYWFLVLSCAVGTAVPWYSYRFSLRTLLIATALVAVALVLIVVLSGQ